MGLSWYTGELGDIACNKEGIVECLEQVVTPGFQLLHYL